MQTIIRGTNAAIRIHITDDIDCSKLSDVQLHIYQRGKAIVKEMQDLDINTQEKTITYKLTQEESLSLWADRPAEITVIGLLDGDRIETRPVVAVNVEDTRQNEVIA